jgi:site-specific DNA-methyltransferase (adenine-specific)
MAIRSGLRRRSFGYRIEGRGSPRRGFRSGGRRRERAVTPYYDEDGITIYHGKCEEVLSSLDLEVNVTVTSPPYNQMSRMGDRGGMHGGGKWVRQNETTAYEDDMPEDEYAAWLISVAAHCAAVTVPGGSMFYNHKVRYRDGVPLHPLELVRSFEGFRLRQEVIWHTGAVAFNARMFAPCDERIYWLVAGEDNHKWNQEAAGFMSIWRMTPPSSIDGHPCPYPIELPTRCIVAASDPGDLVLDPFMGSGTSMRAAKDLGRRGIGVEMREDFCEIAAKRLAQGVLDFGAAS